MTASTSILGEQSVFHIGLSKSVERLEPARAGER